MAAIVVRKLPPDVHAALRRVAAARRQPLEALVRETLSELARKTQGGIDFDKLAKDRAALGLQGDGPTWTPALDDPAFSRKVLGLPSRRHERRPRR